MKKKIVLTILTVALSMTAFVGCSPKTTKQTTEENKTIVVGASQEPHSYLLDEIKEDIEAKGYQLEIKIFSDYVQPNKQLEDKTLDANFFQHHLYLNQQMKDNPSYKFKVVAEVHMEPMGLYSKKYTSIEEIPQGATIAVPNDPTNEARALFVLHENKLIQLDDPTNMQAKAINVLPESKVKIIEMDAAQLTASLEDVDAAMVNTNFALQANMRPGKDALLIEDKNSEAAKDIINILVVREEDENSEKIKILKEAILSPKVKKYLEDKYQGDILPAF